MSTTHHVPAASAARRPTAGRPTGDTSRPGQVRLTRRGRLVLVAVAVLVLVALVLGWGLALSGSEATAEAGSPPAVATIVVSPGETLWELAGPLADVGVADGDVRSVVQQIEELNDLDSAMLLAGQELLVPVVE